MRLLFDRLVAPEKAVSEEPDQQMEELRESIKNELSRITSSQNYFSGWHDDDEKYLLNYGLRDIVSRSATQGEYIRIARELEQNISQFEPRLCDVLISVVADSGQSKYRLKLEAKCSSSKTFEQFTFYLGTNVADVE